MPAHQAVAVLERGLSDSRSKSRRYRAAEISRRNGGFPAPLLSGVERRDARFVPSSVHQMVSVTDCVAVRRFLPFVVFRPRKEDVVVAASSIFPTEGRVQIHGMASQSCSWQSAEFL